MTRYRSTTRQRPSWRTHGAAATLPLCSRPALAPREQVDTNGPPGMSARPTTRRHRWRRTGRHGIGRARSRRMRRLSALDRMVQNFQHNWETNPQFRALWSGGLGLTIIVVMCACMGFAFTFAGTAAARLSGPTTSTGYQPPANGTVRPGSADSNITFPTATVSAWPSPQIPASSPIPPSLTPAPTPTALPSPTPVPTTTGGGGGGGGRRRWRWRWRRKSYLNGNQSFPHEGRRIKSNSGEY